MTHRCNTQRRFGFSLAEMIIAIFILGIGVISVVSLFPMGLTQQRRSTDAILGPTIANNALEVLRSKLYWGRDTRNRQPPQD